MGRSDAVKEHRLQGAQKRLSTKRKRRKVEYVFKNPMFDPFSNKISGSILNRRSVS